MYREYRRKIIACDAEIQKHMALLESKVDLHQNPYQPAPDRKSKAQKKRRISSEDGEFDMGKEAYRIWGVDVTRIPGMQGLN